MDNRVTTVDIFRGRPMGYLTAEEFAKRCGVSKNTIRVWIRRGKIRWVLKIGNDWWIDTSNEKPERKRREQKKDNKLMKESLYFVEEIAEILDVNPETVRRWIRSGVLKYADRRHGYRISRIDLEDYVMNRASMRIRDLWLSKGL